MQLQVKAETENRQLMMSAKSRESDTSVQNGLRQELLRTEEELKKEKAASEKLRMDLEVIKVCRQNIEMDLKAKYSFCPTEP